jgi:oligoendopeptidase F
MQSKEGPAWDIASEYPALDAKELAADLAEVERLLATVTTQAAEVAPYVAAPTAVPADRIAAVVAAAQAAAVAYDRAYLLLSNVRVYCDTRLSVDGRDEAARKLLGGRVVPLATRLGEAFNPVAQLLKLSTDELVDKVLAAPEVAPHRFRVRHERRRKAHALGLSEENLIMALGVDGFSAWGRLYDTLSTAIECKVELPGGVKTMGVAAAASLSQDESEEVRRASFMAIQAGWKTHEESVASILNSLAGWRLEVYRRRSHTKPMHFLDAPLHDSRIERATLEAMMSAVTETQPLARRVLATQAKLLKRPRLSPWDLFAPCPVVATSGAKPGYDEALSVCADAYAAVDPEMGAFVRMMHERRWIEGRVLPTKRPGAYCTMFPKSRAPRVFMTYGGGMRELKTLAHELGHAFHNWVMRDIALPEASYPMTLAETASVLGETCVIDHLLRTAGSPEARLNVCWSNARELEAFLLNIPARFAFEKELYERRQKAPLPPAELSAIMEQAWRGAYGDELSEMDPLFWATKLHFSLASTAFYNFPYTFGYLFALGVYAQRERLGGGFYQAYVSLLRDTGRMTAEEVAAKHLGSDLTKVDFWRDSLRVATKAAETFEDAARPFL